MSGRINIIPIFRSDYIDGVIENDFSDNSDINFCPAVKSLIELKVAAVQYKKVVVLIYAFSDNVSAVLETAAYLNEKKIPSVALCDNQTLYYKLIRQGISTVIEYKPTNNITGKRELLSQIKTKAVDAYNINALKIKHNKENVNISRSNNSYFGFKDTDNRSSDVSNSSLSDKIVDKLIVIGASTGGTEALIEILKRLPAKIPPILIVQHMPPVFTKMYAERCDYFCKFNVHEAKDGDVVLNGNAYIAPGDYHMRLKKTGSGYYLSCKQEEKVNGVCPSVDVLFESVADIMPKKTVGVILTGMGSDGAAGLLQLKQRGAFTIGQDEKSCVVYGMPKEAYKIGAVDVQADIADIAKIILDNI